MAKAKTKRKYTRKSKTFEDSMAKLKSVLMECKIEGCFEVETVPAITKSVTCAYHVSVRVPFPKVRQAVGKSTKPRGWRFMKEFVDADGTVYQRGEEKSKLKGKRPITDVEAIREAQKKAAAEKKAKKQIKLAKIYKKKKLLQRADQALATGDKKKARELKRQAKAVTARPTVAKTIGNFVQVIPKQGY